MNTIREQIGISLVYSAVVLFVASFWLIMAGIALAIWG